MTSKVFLIYIYIYIYIPTCEIIHSRCSGLTTFVEMPFGVQYILFPYIWIWFVCNICFVGPPLALKKYLEIYMDVGIAHLSSQVLGKDIGEIDLCVYNNLKLLASKVGKTFLWARSLPFSSLISSTIFSIVLRTELIF